MLTGLTLRLSSCRGQGGQRHGNMRMRKPEPFGFKTGFIIP